MFFPKEYKIGYYVQYERRPMRVSCIFYAKLPKYYIINVIIVESFIFLFARWQLWCQNLRLESFRSSYGPLVKLHDDVNLI